MDGGKTEASVEKKPVEQSGCKWGHKSSASMNCETSKWRRCICLRGDEFGAGRCGTVCGMAVAWAIIKSGLWSSETMGEQRWGPGMDFGLREEPVDQRCQLV